MSRSGRMTAHTHRPDAVHAGSRRHAPAPDAPDPAGRRVKVPPWWVNSLVLLLVAATPVVLTRVLDGGPSPPPTSSTPTPSASSGAPGTFDAPYRCMGGQGANAAYCAKVTAIRGGSYLALQKEPDYAGMADPHYHGHNGDELIIRCWTKSQVMDGRNDPYWFTVASRDGATGWVNDWYVTTGGYTTWSPLIPHC